MSATVRTDPETLITIEEFDGVVVLRPAGRLDRDLADDVRRQALEAEAPVVVDLSDCVLIDPASVDRLTLGGPWQRPEMCLVCQRATGRQLLVRAGIHRRLSIFGRLDDAIDALAARAGVGWLSEREST